MIKAVLFDLDGTIADTAPDLGYALNRQLALHGRQPILSEQIRTETSNGARGLLKLGFGIAPNDSEYEMMREEFLALYAENLCKETQLFSGISEILSELEARLIPWGIVTNKPSRFTVPLLQALELKQRAAVIISGDDTAHNKPHPEPLLAACLKINIQPQNCLYLGDDLRDVQASRAASIMPIIAGYGYLGNHSRPDTWGAD
ncbi:MAG: HAD-IA family hydrolase, partial [Nitrosomonas sp.]|nr:HAD-IA family hydrolase [Nitrosomonas sp.]